jgi:hypothetical protein
MTAGQTETVLNLRRRHPYRDLKSFAAAATATSNEVLPATNVVPNASGKVGETLAAEPSLVGLRTLVVPDA